MEKAPQKANTPVQPSPIQLESLKTTSSPSKLEEPKKEFIEYVPSRNEATDARENQTVININNSHNYSSHECSYSKVSGGSTSCGFHCEQVTTLDYADMMERGWRRCGTYFYKQDNMKNHWPYYTIRMEANKHVIRKSHKKIWNRWQRYLRGERDIVEENDEKSIDSMDEKDKPKQVIQKPVSLETQKTMKELKEKLVESWDVVVELVAGSPGKEAATASMKDKLQTNLDKKEEGVIFSNMINLICSALKLQPKTISKESLGKIREKLAFPSLKVEITENGLARWTPESKMENEMEPASDKKKEPETKPKKIDEEKISKSSKDKAPKKLTPRKFEMKLVRAECTAENFDLYKRYCADIHQSKKEDKGSYDNFLCQQTLVYREFESKSKHVLRTGCFHMNYYLDGALIGVGVVDSVLKGLSSVYLFHDPKFKPLRFGIVTGLYEIDYIQRVNKEFPLYKYYYLGFYIQQCDKMNYKADFEPCELLSPVTNRFVQLTPALRKQIDEKKPRLDPVDMTDEEKQANEFSSVQNIGEFLIQECKLLNDGDLVAFKSEKNLQNLAVRIAKLRSDVFFGLGKKLTRRSVFEL